MAVETLEALPHFGPTPNLKARPVEKDAAAVLPLQAVGVLDPVVTSSVTVGTEGTMADAVTQGPMTQVGSAVRDTVRSLSSGGAIVGGVALPSLP